MVKDIPTYTYSDLGNSRTSSGRSPLKSSKNVKKIVLVNFNFLLILMHLDGYCFEMIISRKYPCQGQDFG